jgi:hypothetical protein
MSPVTGFRPPDERRRRLSALSVAALGIIVAIVRFAGPELLAHKVLHVDTCDAAGINTTKGLEGTCTTGSRLPGAHTTYIVVNSGRVLRMPGYHVQLLAMRKSLLHILPGVRYSTRVYPGGQAVLYSFQLAVTNDGSRPLSFDPSRQEMTVAAPNSSSPTTGFDDEYAQLRPIGVKPPLPAPQFPLPDAIAPHHTVIGWASFASPARSRPNQRGSDLNLLTPGEAMVAGAHLGTIGEIRLWKWDNTQGRVALGVPSFSFAGSPSSGAGQISN